MLGHVTVVGSERRSGQLRLLLDQVERLAQGRRVATEPNDLALQQEDPLLQCDPAVLGGSLAEDVVLQIVGAVLEGFDDREVAVDDLVDQHVHGEAASFVREQLRLRAPSATRPR